MAKKAPDTAPPDEASPDEATLATQPADLADEALVMMTHPAGHDGRIAVGESVYAVVAGRCRVRPEHVPAVAQAGFSVVGP